ncbi:hypothetical protein [Paracraurococcus ruber]|uniref:Uncharacterized protein n=1 Tax=Paracraurococcus ruber TaxID=77675 RepID=A0ABS1CQW2_9PROT|nr:hypothetical protein [Paracraurococcus ruber]MBK1656832.1 hypothetical protein [Paracraurococcus ruber]
MSNWSMPAASRMETLGAGTGEGVTVTASAAANAKGSYATLGTAGLSYSGFVLQMLPANSGKYRVDVAINTGGSDQVIVEDWLIDATSSGASRSVQNLWLPIAIPSGAAVKARCQAATGSHALRVLLTGYAQDFPGFPGFRALRSLTTFSATEAPTVTQNGTTQTATWQEFSATPLAEPVAALYFAVSTGGDNARTTSRWLAEVASGASGSEVSRLILQGAQNTTDITPGVWGPFPAMLPPSTRLSFKVQCQAAAVDTFGLAAYGLIP